MNRILLTHHREFGSMAGRLENYEAVLQYLQTRVDSADSLAIQKALEKVYFLISYDFGHI